jgi:pyrroloquinoline-quinone synthase
VAAAGEAVGLSRDRVEACRPVLPGVRFAVDAYVNFARRAPWPEAVCSSLTELFAPEIHKQRLANWPSTIPGSTRGSAVFPEPGEPRAARRRIRPCVHAGSFHHTRLQERALEILKFKLDVLWQMSDAMALRYMG